MIKINKEGKEYYYYYKKKNGRHKKCGRKHQNKKRGRSWQKTWNYKIIKCSFNKQDEFIGVYHDAIEVEKIKQSILSDNEKVVFPSKYVSSSRIKDDRYGRTEYKTEYVILERVNNENIDKDTKLRDKYGRFITQTTNSETWKVYDKIPYIKEETFWVYGYNPQTDRKTFMWIYNNIVLDNINKNKTSILQITLYKNKLVFVYDSNILTFISCKNTSDSIRLYNLLSKKSATDKIKRCYFMGQVTSYDERGKYLLNKLQNLTGWKLTKLRQSYN